MNDNDPSRKQMARGATSWNDGAHSRSLHEHRTVRASPSLEVVNTDGVRVTLTRLELKIVSDIVAGYEDCEVARRASLKPRALARHLTAVCRKLGVHDRLELALLLSDRGL